MAQEILAIVTELDTASVTGRSTVLGASSLRPRARLALAVLRSAPDLADAVKSGHLDLTHAHRVLTAPTEAARVDYYLKMAEVASVLRVSRGTVYRLASEGKLQVIRPGPRLMLISEALLCDYLVGQAIAVIERLGRCAPSTRP